MGKTGENSGMAADESQKQERGDRGSKELRAEKFILRHRWICVILRIRSWSLNINSTKAGSYSEATL